MQNALFPTKLLYGGDYNPEQGHAYNLATQSNNELLDKLTKLLCEQANVSPVLESAEGVLGGVGRLLWA